jgi:hypothetical protein
MKASWQYFYDRFFFAPMCVKQSVVPVQLEATRGECCYMLQLQIMMGKQTVEDCDR